MVATKRFGYLLADNLAANTTNAERYEVRILFSTRVKWNILHIWYTLAWWVARGKKTRPNRQTKTPRIRMPLP